MVVDAQFLRACSEQEVVLVREYAAVHEGAPISSGQCSLGDICQGTMRPLVAPSPAVYSTGRGAGNILSGAARRAEQIDADERRYTSPHDGPCVFSQPM